MYPYVYYLCVRVCFGVRLFILKYVLIVCEHSHYSKTGRVFTNNVHIDSYLLKAGPRIQYTLWIFDQ